MIRLWLQGLYRRRKGRMLAAVAGVAIAVALIGSLGSFLAAAQATMTSHAAAAVGVDWQIQLTPGADVATALATTLESPGVAAALPVGYTTVEGAKAATGTTSQTTGAATVVGLPPGYPSTFPDEIRIMAGSADGAMIAQQTAANLHVAPGDTVSLLVPGNRTVDVTISGVVDLPQSTSLFQTVGAPSQLQPSAPPDNVILLPAAGFATLTSPLGADRPDAVRTQIHARYSAELPAAPADSFVAVTAAGHNLEAALAGSGVIGNNLAAALDSARSDAAYSNVLFLFLGLPGVALAGMLTAAVAGSGTVRRRREQALLRARGASVQQVARVAVVEACVIGVAGGVVGLAAAAALGTAVLGSPRFGASTGSAVLWAAAATAAGLFVSAGSFLGPAWRDARALSVTGSRSQLDPNRSPWWLRAGLDVIALALAWLVFLATTRTGYTLVLAPEGVPSITVDYWAFLGPALLWLGSGMMTWRLVNILLRRPRLMSVLVGPLAGRLASTASSTLYRQRNLVAQSVVLLTVAVAFAGSTAAFNATYQQQAEVDAFLTNGADVTITATPAGSLSAGTMAAAAALPGVSSSTAMLHRFAYIGADLQDIFGVDPSTIAASTSLQDTYFQGITAREAIQRLALDTHAILVSAETVKDYQLNPGDALTLRVQDAATLQYVPVAFTYAGIVSEFPTAPKDSFFVANGTYLAQQTHASTANVLLLNTGAGDVNAVTSAATDLVGASATVTGINGTRTALGSSLAAINLAGLTAVELVFAVVLAAAASGLLLVLTLSERRRTFAIATVLGATPGQLRRLVLSEAAFITVTGSACGIMAGSLLSGMLVRVLSGVFDPPPQGPAVPYAYLALLLAVTAGAALLVTFLAFHNARHPAVEQLREA